MKGPVWPAPNPPLTPKEFEHVREHEHRRDDHQHPGCDPGPQDVPEAKVKRKKTDQRPDKAAAMVNFASLEDAKASAPDNTDMKIYTA